MKAYTAYLYDNKNNLLGSRSSDCSDKLLTNVLYLLENFPIGTRGVIYDHTKKQMLGSYIRRVIE